VPWIGSLVRMTKVLASGYTNTNSFYLDYSIEAAEYKTLREKVIDGLVAEVEINGFRKGKAPRDKALENINPQVMGQKILETVLNTYSSPAAEEVNILLKKEERIVSGLELDYKPEFTSEQEDGSFKMRVVATLLPSIDMKGVDSLKIKQPSKSDITDLPDFLEFKKTEVAKLMTEQNVYDPSEEGVVAKEGLLAVVDMHGSMDGKEVEGLHSHGMQVVIGAGGFLPVFETNLIGLKKGDSKEFDLPFPENYATEMAGKTAQVKITVVDILTPKFASVDELLEGKEDLKKFYTDKDALEKDIENVYNARTEQVLDNIRRKRVVEEVLKAVPDFDLDSIVVEEETNRIYTTLLQDASAKGVSAGIALQQAGISTKDTKELEKLTKDQVKSEIEAYVKNEVKLTNILSQLYQTRVENKPTSEEFEATIKDAMADKKKYNLEESFDEARVRNIINDRIIRQAAGNYLMDIAKKNV
jgi:trigger factor